ncbi:MAG: 16S rRNA (cytosine(1402)-N(4))-methyltransferase [Coxiella sp. RIFCSPHIGHO2_12_FULL_44_14]|nr:MAG: 16S rRNA (cytosine(1402)-N(4))-methyltransferase [Coxiella sp. RIFCSPHIGHO2_12_FULL_44_14]
MAYEHRPVLFDEVMRGLAIRANGVYVDGTFGGGGHSLGILQRLGPEGRLIALDKDLDAIQRGTTGPFRDSRFCGIQDSFSHLELIVRNRGWHGKIDGIVLDLGVSSFQLDNPARGFSFTKDGPLDMRMDTRQSVDAAAWIHEASEAEIARVLRDYGEERYARRIARAIVKARIQKPITRTQQLSDIIISVSPIRGEKKHPATRSFQAIRIFINRELEELRDSLSQCLEVLAVGGRLCVISFHSLEDRLVKQFIHRESREAAYPPDLPIRESQIHYRLRKIGALIRPITQEITVNPRARSARLRIAEKIA